MAFNFDNIISGAKDIFDKASVKAGEAIDYSKNQIDRTQCKAKMKEKFTELGKAYYESVKNGADNAENIKCIIDDIDDIAQKIAELDVKKEKICPACGASNSNDGSFCTACGGKLE